MGSRRIVRSESNISILKQNNPIGINQEFVVENIVFTIKIYFKNLLQNGGIYYIQGISICAVFRRKIEIYLHSFSETLYW